MTRSLNLPFGMPKQYLLWNRCITACCSIWLWFTVGCTYNDYLTPLEKLPPETQIGANTAGCLRDGEILIPYDADIQLLNTSYNGIRLKQGLDFWPDKNDYWHLKIINTKGQNFYFMSLWINNMSVGVGDYPLQQPDNTMPPDNYMVLSIHGYGPEKLYYSGPHSGVIHVTRADLAPGISIYSGTFQCTLYNINNPSDSIQITKGRFDINGLTLNQ